MVKKVISILMLTALLLAAAAPALAAPPPENVVNVYPNTYVNTGNQRQDLIGVALTQIGYTEIFENDTKYGDWYGYPEQAWCAMFISWCAEQADISTDILKKSAWATPRNTKGFNIPCYSGTDYTPLPGDLLFMEDFNHVGIVYEVKGDTVITIEANTNNDGSDDGYYTMFIERKLSECDVGVPPYKGCDKNHTYVRGCDEAHPHANYYHCTTCGDSYYTGSYGHVTGCGSCMSCGCTVTSGWYRVTAGKRLVVRSGHSTGYGSRGYLDVSEPVYVVATNGAWGHIVYANSVGYVPMDRLEKFMPAPAQIQANKASYYKNDTATVSWSDVKLATNYTVTVLRDGTPVQRTAMGNVTTWNLAGLQPGQYEIQVTADDGSLTSEPAVCGFRVLNTYSVTYDAAGGIGAPESQLKPEDQTLSLRSEVPTREGAVFLGWAVDKTSNYAVYQPGEAWNENRDAVLYAVWRSETAVPAKLEIHTPAVKTTYVVGQALDTAGLTLKLRYDDSSAVKISEGYTVQGFTSQKAGTVTVTLQYEDVQTSYAVEVLAYVPGDIDGNLSVNKEDVMQLLWHVSFPELYPILIPADYTGDGRVDKEDVMQLLWHVSFPELYPLN